jgi:hypothetical protein
LPNDSHEYQPSTTPINNHPATHNIHPAYLEALHPK